MKPGPKPEQKPEPRATPKLAPPTARIRVERKESNNYLVVVDKFSGQPESTTVLARGVSLLEAQQLVKAWWLEALGPQGYGDSGL